MGPLGVPELLFILLLALLVFGPKKLPEIGRAVGKGLGEFRRASNELKRSLNAELALEEETSRPKRPEPPRLAAPAATVAATAPGATPAAAAVMGGTEQTAELQPVDASAIGFVDPGPQLEPMPYLPLSPSEPAAAEPVAVDPAAQPVEPK